MLITLKSDADEDAEDILMTTLVRLFCMVDVFCMGFSPLVQYVCRASPDAKAEPKKKMLFCAFLLNKKA